MPALNSRIRAMQNDRYVLCLSSVDYRSSMGGLGRYLRDELELLWKRQVSSLCLFPFPTRRNPRLDRHLAQYWGVTIDGKLAGFYRFQEILGLLAELGQAGKRPLEAQIHHLKHFDLRRVADLLAAVPVAVKVFLHDYYAICPGAHLLKNWQGYCGAIPPGPATCADCMFWTPAHQGRIRELLAGLAGRVTVVAPAPVAQRIWQAAYPDLNCPVRVIPHLKETGEIPNPYQAKQASEPVRIAYVGAPVAYKGWDVFRQMAEASYRQKINCRYYHFGLGRSRDPHIRNIPVSNVVDGPAAMTRAIQAAGIDIVLLWALWPETYSYTLFESLLANVMIVTNPESGNIAETVAHRELGKIFRTEAELRDYAQAEAQMRTDVDFYRGRRAVLPAGMVPNEAILDTLDFAANPLLPRPAGPVRSAGHVTALYRVKLLKQRIMGR